LLSRSTRRHQKSPAQRPDLVTGSDELEGVMAAQLVAAQFPRVSRKRRAWCRAQWLLLHVEGSEGCVSRPARPCL